LKRFLAATAVLAAAVAVFAWQTFPPKQAHLPPPFADGTIPGSLHIHSTRSDGRGSVDDIARAAAAVGLKFIVVTDHGDGTRAPDPPAYRDGVLCLDAVEISSAGGHYIALDLPQAPYPLGGEARDVVEDVKRLGGFGVAAHPDSPKAELSWRGWSTPFDGIEFLNPDTSWREQIAPAFNGRAALPTPLLWERIFSYPFRPAESIAGLIQPTRILDKWAAVARQRPVVVVAGTDAHAQIALRSADPAETRAAIPIPAYDVSFRALTVRLRVDRPLNGDAAADAALVVRAIRAGHLYSTVDGVATPPALEFTASNAAGTARAGDTLPASGETTLHVRSNAPASFTTTVWNGATPVASDRRADDFTVTEPTGHGGVYWVEIRADATARRVPWITSNPIYIRAADAGEKVAGRPAATQRQPLLGPGTRAAWRAEYDPTSIAALDLPAAAESAGASQARLRFGLASGPAEGQFAAIAVDLATGIGLADRVTFTARAEQPMRVSVQLRSERGRWQRSVYVDTTDQERTVFFDELTAVGNADSPRPPRAEIRGLLFVVDAVHTKPGTSSRLWITNPALAR
jgi:hypothetical protein